MLMGLCCLVFLIFYLRSLSWTSILVVIIAAASLWMSMQFADQQYLSLTRINKLFNSDLSSGERTSGRSVIAMAGIEVFLEHPLGVGTGGFKEAVAEVGWFGDEGRMAHSAWIKILGENGFPGLLAFFLFIGSYAVVGWLKKEKDLLLIGLLVTVVLSVGFLAHELQGKGLWFLAAGGSTFLHKDQLVDYMQYSRKNRLVKRYAARLNDKSGEIHAAN
jgi:O-antigen ligase